MFEDDWVVDVFVKAHCLYIVVTTRYTFCVI